MRQRVIEAARDRGLEVRVTTLAATTRTVGEAAAAVGCTPSQIAKSIVFVADGDPIVCVAAGSHRVDTELVRAATDSVEVRQASPDEVRAATGFSVGGVAPLGHDLPTVLDRALLDHERVWAAGGDGNSLFEVDPRVLADRTGATVAAIGAGAS